MKYTFQSSIVGIGLAITCGCTMMVKTKPVKDEPSASALEKPVQGVTYFLPRGRIQVDVTWSEDTHEWLIKIAPVVEADTAPESKFSVVAKKHWFFDSDVTINADANGLLSTMNGTLTDQTANSIGNLVSAAASAFTMAATMGLSLPAKPSKAEIDLLQDTTIIRSYNTPNYSFHGSFVPDIQDELDTPELTVPETNLAGMDNGKVYLAKFKFKASRVEHYPDNEISTHQSFTNAIAKRGGVIVRLPVRYKITVNQVIADDINEALMSSEDNAKLTTQSVDTEIIPSAKQRFIFSLGAEKIKVGQLVKLVNQLSEAANQSKVKSVSEQVVILPDSKHDYFLPMEGRMFVSDANQIGFVSGMPLQIHIVRPSIVAGITSIPKSLLSTLVPIPGNIYQTQDNYYKSKDDAAKATTDTDTIK